MNQLTKVIVILSTLSAAFVELYLATPFRDGLMWITIVATAVAVIFGHRAQGAIARPILIAMYLMPAAYLALLDYEHFSLEIIWILPLLGLIVSDRGAWQWSLPQSWRWPLVAWALVVAVSWPIVFLRETDFALWVLPFGVANTSVGISPWQANMTVTYFVLGHNAGLLWVDALFRWFSRAPGAAFTSRILTPLAAAIAISCLVGAYQGLIDLAFLSGHVWPHLRRAAGTLADANAFGVIAALWAPAFVVLARGFSQPWSMVVGIGGVALASMGVLTSGSRTALILLTIGIAALAFESVRAWRRTDGPSLPSRRQLATMIIGGIAVAAIALVVARGSLITSIGARGSFGYIPFFGELGIRESAHRLLWDRFGYGPAAVQMIVEHPWAGVGVGTFHTLVNDFAMLVNGKALVPDNAQSWYRHLLAELGLLGSLPWIAWCIVFVSTLFSRAPADRDRFSLGILRGVLVGFGIIAVIGMPGQSLTVIMTFWTLAYWFAALKGIAAPPGVSEKSSWPKAVWFATLALVAVHAAITYANARGDLLPRNRSTRFGWDYRYGIADPEPSPDGGPGRRWAGLKSMSMVPVRGKVLRFVAWIDHPDGDERPVHVRVWVDKKMIYDDDLKRSASIVRDIPAPPGRTHIVVETEISRMWRPRDFGRSDPRELGLSIRDWTWE
ncbi:MAG: hypothetical protein Q7J25_05050 [Vicinamibacterales bacterium]|nr:hypothetical protein [Vicinamibacterales bacterium]